MNISDICSSPQLFAAYHVLLRLLVPRHSPYALSSLTSDSFKSYRFLLSIGFLDFFLKLWLLVFSSLP